MCKVYKSQSAAAPFRQWLNGSQIAPRDKRSEQHHGCSDQGGQVHGIRKRDSSLQCRAGLSAKPLGGIEHAEDAVCFFGADGFVLVSKSAACDKFSELKNKCSSNYARAWTQNETSPRILTRLKSRSAKVRFAFMSIRSDFWFLSHRSASVSNRPMSIVP